MAKKKKDLTPSDPYDCDDGIHRAAFHVLLPVQQIKRVEALANERQIRRSQLVSEALAKFMLANRRARPAG